MKRISFGLILLAALLTLEGRAAETASPDAAFDAANKLYAQSKFAEAAAAFDQIATANGTSPALYFNLGNACFKSGQIGRAIAAYRQAAALTPRDPDVRANLQFARNQVQGPTVHSSRLQRAVGALSHREWLTLTTVMVWVAFGLLTLRFAKPALAPALKPWTWLAGAMALLLGISTAIAQIQSAPGQSAIICKRDVAVRNSPFDESPAAFTAQDGAELAVLDSKDQWLQVTDGAKRVGWVKREAVIYRPKATP